MADLRTTVQAFNAGIQLARLELQGPNPFLFTRTSDFTAMLQSPEVTQIGYESAATCYEAAIETAMPYLVLAEALKSAPQKGESTRLLTGMAGDILRSQGEVVLQKGMQACDQVILPLVGVYVTLKLAQLPSLHLDSDIFLP